MYLLSPTNPKHFLLLALSSQLVTNPERFRQPVPQAVLEEEGDEPEVSWPLKP